RSGAMPDRAGLAQGSGARREGLSPGDRDGGSDGSQQLERGVKALIVLAHPERCSFNGRMAELAQETLREAGHTAWLSDLYAKGFDPVEHAQHYAQRERADRFDVQLEQRAASDHGRIPADVMRELDLLERADLLILQFPMWWFSIPAILKGWI